MISFQIWSMVVIGSIFMLLIFLRYSNRTMSETEQCGYQVEPVHTAYLVMRKNGRVITSATLTFSEDRVISQCPAGGSSEWQIPNFVGCDKLEVSRFQAGENTVNFN